LPSPTMSGIIDQRYSWVSPRCESEQYMSIHDRLLAFWAGERPDEIPYTTYFSKDRNMLNDPRWAPLFAKGLGVTFHIYPYEEIMDDVDVIEQHHVENGVNIRREIRRTPVGEISATWAEAWQRKYWLETPEDYRVMTYIVDHTETIPRYEGYLEEERRLPPFGVALSIIRRTPLQTILVDLAGLEQFGWHLYEYEDAVRTLYEALLRQFRRRVEIAAEGPGRFIANLENFTAETLGPKRYAQFLLPVYEECFPILHQAGKIVGTHYDGRTASCRDLIAASPIDLIESLTAPPEGDQPLADARAAWPGKLLWVNINMAAYDLPANELHDLVLQMVADAAPDGRRLAFEISEDLPPRWQESVPVILEALKETRA